MPLFDYRCKDCGSVIEIFEQPGTPSPRLCGFRCPLPPDDGRECRGQGSLERLLPVIGGQVHSVRGTPSPERAAKAGFTSFENTGKGLRKIAGDGEK